MTDYVATRWYRSPELLVSGEVYGKAIDLWAIACIMGELADGQPLFPGESEIDQLYVIQKVLGPMTARQNELFSKNPRYIGLKFPEMQRPTTLEAKYRGRLSRVALSFMSALLRMDPKERMTSSEALSHPYFEGLREGAYDRPATSLLSDAVRTKPRLQNLYLNKAKNRTNLLVNHTPTEVWKPETKLKEESSSPPLGLRGRARKKAPDPPEPEFERQRSKELLKTLYEPENKKSKKRSVGETHQMFHIHEEETSPRVKSLPKKKTVPKLHFFAEDNSLQRGQSKGVFRPSEEETNQQSVRQLPNIHQHHPVEFFNKRGESRMNQREDPETGGGPQFLHFPEDSALRYHKGHNYELPARR